MAQNEVVVIVPIRPGSVYFGCDFRNKITGVTYTVTKDFRIHENVDKAWKELNRNNFFSFKFHPAQTEFRIEYDPHSVVLFEKYKKAFVELLLQHPQMLNSDNIPNENLGTPSFRMVFVNRVDKSEALSMRDKVDAGNKYCNLTFEACQDVGFMFGKNSFEYKRSELDKMLIGKNLDGVLMMDQNILEFMKYNPKDEKTMYRIIINKARYLNLLSVSSAGYEMNNEYMGKEMPDVIAYFYKNPQKFDWLKSAVKKGAESKMPEDDIKSKQPVKEEFGKVKPKYVEPKISFNTGEKLPGFSDQESKDAYYNNPKYPDLASKAESLGLNPNNYTKIQALNMAIIGAENRLKNSVSA